ncbi:MAG: Carboxy-terminal domain (CTD) phosphatase [Chrysothrix sp. TS-e1954]|nr:MAG: Carboxy-terminal domain (CTD) phosphatase [Chrysothrix sp. TS-e1954]
MLLRSPTSLHYPITVTELLKRPNDNVARSAAIFAYSYKSKVTEGNRYGEEEEVQRSFITNFEVDIDGTLTKWLIRKNDVLSGPNMALCEVAEACRHDVQYGGMCANCGKDMTDVDYNTSLPNTLRADTAISHINTALKISKEEAARVDESIKRRLLNGKRLSLVLDLDLTIIQATVDPTIGEWQRDESNPNYEFVKNVRSFELYDESLRRDVSYYVKLRPGLEEFLDRISQLYELHIYTMGTRAYAQNIAKIVDPQAKLFGDRILSRTETPGEEVKNLRKLFPVDTRMVVIIDDRADVWRWSNYLVRVNPYDFFTGIGDINSSFLPKKEELTAKQNKAAAVAAPEHKMDVLEHQQVHESIETNGNGQGSDLTNGDLPNGDESALEHMVSMQESSETPDTQQEEQDEALAAQLNDRPLLRQQKLLEEEAEDDFSENGDAETVLTEVDRSNSPRLRHHLLKDDDTELQRIEEELTNIHNRFYALYEQNVASSSGGRVAQLKGAKALKRSPDDALLVVPDVKDVIKPFSIEPLKGAHLVFSGIVPLGTSVHDSQFARKATHLGATVSTSIEAHTTHVVARHGDPTSKMREAARNPEIKIVSSDWLFDSYVSWNQKVDETHYLIWVTPNQDDDNGEEEKSEAELEAEMNGAPGPRLRIDPDKSNADDADGDDDLAVSPVENCDQKDWDDMYAEIDDLSDDSNEPDDRTSDNDNDSHASSPLNPEEDGGTDGFTNPTHAPTPDAQSTPQTASSADAGKKRKRPDLDPTSIHTGHGSNLQRRKRQALGRSSSLTNMNMAYVSSDATTPRSTASSVEDSERAGMTLRPARWGEDAGREDAGPLVNGEAEVPGEDEEEEEDEDEEDQDEATRRLMEAMEGHGGEDANSDAEAVDEGGERDDDGG